MKKILASLTVALMIVSTFSIFISSVKACPLFIQENAVFMTNMNIVPITHSFVECPESSPMFVLELSPSDSFYELSISFYLNDTSVAAFLKVIYCDDSVVYRAAIPSSSLQLGWNTLTATLPRPAQGEIHGVRIVGVAGHRDDDGTEPWEGVIDESFGSHEGDWNVKFGDGYFKGKTAEDLDWYEYEVAYHFTLKTPGVPSHNPFIGSLTITPSKTTLSPGETFTVTARYYRYSYCPSDYFKFLFKNEATGAISEAGRWAAGYWQMVSYGWQTFTLTLKAPSTAGTYTLKAVGCSGHGSYDYYGVNWNDPRSDGGFIGHKPEELSWTYYEIAATATINIISYTVTVTIVEVRAIDAMDPFGGAADFYAKVSIDGVFLPDAPVYKSDDNDIYPEWSFSRTVSKTIIPIHIEIWDDDLVPPDDHVDIDNDGNDWDLDISFDVATQTLSGDVTFGYSEGGGGDGNRAAIWFNVGLDGGDRDGDGLFDSWETTGIHMDGDGVVDVDLRSLGANPLHKDLFVEIDWMADQTHSHRPTNAAMQTVINSFANAPVSNPDGTNGINLHIDFSNSVNHQDEITFPGDFDAIKLNNFDKNRRFVYHYCLFAHRIAGTIGISEVAGNDFAIGFGDVSDDTEQAGVFMHELGHNLNLRHGGGDDVNFKPNYLSVMNYFFADRGIPPTNRIDYSRQALPNLDENNLNENVGIQNGADNTMFYTPDGVIETWPGTGAIDWDDDNIIEASVQADINRDGIYLGPIRHPRLTILTGYDDWSNIKLNTRGMPFNQWADFVHENIDIEVDLETLRSIRPSVVIQKFAEGLQAVPLYTSESWNFTIIVTNIYDYNMTNVTVKDYFGANLNVALIGLTKGTYKQFINKPTLQQRYEWNIGNLAPWETVTLKLKVSTGLNPANKQEFTKAGLKILNSGATVKWINSAGYQESAETGQVSIWAGVSVSSTTGAIAGYVRNATTGEPLQDYVVELRSLTGELLASVTTDKNGFYAFSGLEPTDYTVICQTISYTVTVVAEQVTRVDFEFP